MNPLSQSYDYCRELTGRTAHNFRFSFLTLPSDKRQAMNALYAFSRITDDLGDDEAVTIELRRARLAAWRASLRKVLNISSCDEQANSADSSEAGMFFNHPAHLAIADTVSTHCIPLQSLFAIIDGVEQDLQPVEMKTFGELERYCYLVAGAVGQCCIHIWGFHDERAVSLATDCGLAFQLTNILRDIREDVERGRIYLPEEDLVRFGYSADDVRQHVMNDAFLQLMRFQTARAQTYYKRAEQLFLYLDPPGKPVLRTMLDIYGGLLKEIERRNFDVFTKRISLPRWKKLWFAGRAILFQSLFCS